MATTRLSRHIRATRAVVYRALLDPKAVQQWMVPDDMTSHVHSFDAREGGAFRISLTYNIPTAAGKTTAQTDAFHGRFIKLVPDTEVVEVVEFETDDPTMQGSMTITYRLADADDGTLLSGIGRAREPAFRSFAYRQRAGLEHVHGQTRQTGRRR